MAILADIIIDDVTTWDVLEPRDGNDSFVAICKQLGLSVEAKDRESLLATAQNALDELAADLTAHNDSIPFLTERGIRFKVKPIQQEKGGLALSLPHMRAETYGALSA